MSSFKIDLESDKNVLSVSEFIRDRLYFVTFKSKSYRNTPLIHYFSIDDELVYRNYYGDFGPFNIAAVYKYNQILTYKLWNTQMQSKKIVHYTIGNGKKRTNAAFLIGTFAIFYLDMPPREVYKVLSTKNLEFLFFQDASPISPNYLISLMDCFCAFKKAVTYGFINLNDFCLNEFNKYDSLMNGDMSWIIPNKLLAFSGPWDKPPGQSYHTPAFYVEHFKRIGIKTVIRLNIKTYSAATFTKAGITHYDLFFPDGTCPTEEITMYFLKICESTPHAVAVHCKAGLGRTGCLIGAYLIKHFYMTALEAIAWMRICRPGSVIGSQQSWLQNMERSLLALGDQYRIRFHGGRDKIIFCKYGIYSKQQLDLLGGETTISKIVPVVQYAKSSPTRKQNLIKMSPREMPLVPNIMTHKQVLTQGDKLNLIKFKNKKNNKKCQMKCVDKN